MIRNWSLRAKLTAWSALVVGVALLICGIGLGLFIETEQIEALDDQLRNEAHTFFGEVSRHGQTLDWHDHSLVQDILPLTRTERFVEIADAQKRILYQSEERGAHFSVFPEGMQTVKAGEHDIRLGVFTQDGYTLCFGAALNEISADNTGLLHGFLIGLPCLLATIAGGGWWLARKALAPVRAITAAAEQITADRLDQRLPVPPTRDEIGRLAVVLNDTFDRLEKAFRQAKRFSADASHELKTPLTILRATIEDLLASSHLDEPGQRALTSLLEQTRRLSSITESLLLLSHADAGKLKLNLVETNVSEVLNACAEDARIMAEAREISIETAVPRELPAMADPDRLAQIFLNLLDNAIKYNHPHGRVRIGAEIAGHEVNITIANTGDGVRPEHPAQLFERFFRSDPAPDVPGQGLGLSLARELARAHSGEVSLVQSDAHWTTFVIRLPAAGRAASPALGPRGEKPGPRAVHRAAAAGDSLLQRRGIGG